VAAGDRDMEAQVKALKDQTAVGGMSHYWDFPEISFIFTLKINTLIQIAQILSPKKKDKSL
jgi:hypothetical protein